MEEAIPYLFFFFPFKCIECTQTKQRTPNENRMNIKNQRMNNWKNTIEYGFGMLGRVIAKHPLLWFFSYLIVIAGLASQIIHIRQDTSIEGFLEKGAIEIQRYDEFKDTFGRDEVLMIGIETDNVFDQDFVDNLRAFHEQLESEVPFIDRVDSLINARHTYGADDTLYIEDLLPEQLPEDAQELQALKDYTYDNPNYVNFLISKDREYIALVVQLKAYKFEKNKQGETEQHYLEDQDLEQAMQAVYKVTEQYREKFDGDISIAGSVPISLMIGNIVERDFAVFTVLAILIIGSILAFIFRRLSGVTMPLIVMALGVTATISAMAIMDTPLQISTSILPSFLLAVCVGDSIHLLTIFYRHYDERDEKVEALVKALEHTGLAIFFTSITTAAGLASFASSDLTPVSALGFYGALGSILAFLLTIFILPCLICLLPLKRKTHRYDESSRLQAFLGWCVHFSTSQPKTIVSVAILLFIGATYTASQVRFSHWPIDWLPEDNNSLRALKTHESRLGGSLAIEVVLDTGKDRGITNADFLKNMDKLSRELEAWQTEHIRVVKVTNVTDIIKESNRALHDNNEDFFTIPDDSDLISQELFLVEMDKPEDLYNMIDQQYRRARLTILIPWVDSLYLVPFLEKLDVKLDESLGPYTERIYQTGVTPILSSTFVKMLYSTAESYGIAVIVITFMMILLIGSFKLGLISMLPSLLPITLVLAMFQLANTPLDMLTMLVGSIAIGLTVDDNVHFMHGFRRLYAKSGDPAYAIEHTLLTSGRAMFITSVVLSVGFFIYTQSAMKNMVSFGIMTALCIILALAATFILAPALMMLVNKKVP